jgi:flagellar motility protein MotE (MotC chaperone)
MKKIHIIIAAVAGLVCFGGSFFATKLLKKPVPAIPEIAETQQESQQTAFGDDFQIAMASTSSAPQEDARFKNMQIRQLQNLIYDIRERTKEHRQKENGLAREEQRIQTAKNNLQADIERLEKLRVELTASLSALKREQENLKTSQMEITKIEETNMKLIAGKYDKMKPEQSSPIVTQMIANQQLKDVVMILYYMEDKTAAKLLGSLDPKIAAALLDRLKRITESG